MKHFDVCIVGSGHGGAQIAIALRQQGYCGSIGMITKDPEFPYQRPPLTKEYLSGKYTFERMQLRPPQFWSDKAIELLLAQEVTKLNAETRILTTADDGQISYSELVWATGGDPRKLTCAGADLDGVYSIRNKSDVDGLMQSLATDPSTIAIIGGGFIGLEAAAVLSELGWHVTLLEAQDRILSRVTSETLSHFFESDHRAHGVDIRLSAQIDSIEGDNGTVVGIRIDDGTLIPCQAVIVGIGIIPQVTPLQEAGASCENGVLIDEHCKTSLPGIYAIGDCAAHYSLYSDGMRVRLESVQNANDMAVIAAKSICNKPQPYEAVPWFWSNQFDLKLQTVGLSAGHDQTIVRGSPQSRKFSVIYLKQGAVIALDCVNSARDYVQGRKLVEARARVNTALLADHQTPLKEIY